MSATEAGQEPATLVGLLDGLIDRGVNLSGDIVIGLADVELIRVALRLLVASEDTVQRTAAGGVGGATAPHAALPDDRPARTGPEPEVSAPARRALAPRRAAVPAGASSGAPAASSIAQADRDDLVRGVSQLVLTLVEVLRELLERQAIRRVEAGTLTDDQVERLGLALQALEERMAELKEVFGFGDEDLNLDLGPLGRLR